MLSSNFTLCAPVSARSSRTWVERLPAAVVPRTGRFGP